MHTVEKLIRDYFDALNRADHMAVSSLLADDVVHDLKHGERELGRERFVEGLKRRQGFSRERIRDVVVMVGSDLRRAAAEYVVEGSQTEEPVHEHHAPFATLPAGTFFEIRNGHIARITEYTHRGEHVSRGSEGT